MDWFINLSRYIYILLSIVFLLTSIALNRKIYKGDSENGRYFYKLQRGVILSMHFIGFLILAVTSDEPLEYLILYAQQALFYVAFWFITMKFYRYSNQLIWNIALYMINVGFLILTRLNYGGGLRQFRIVLLGFLVALIIPFIFTKVRVLKNLEWVYIIMSFTLLLMVNATINGASNWVSYGNFSFQPSEFVKVLYILFLAGLFKEGVTIIRFIISAVASLGIVIILVLQTDLGGALIFSVLFITIIYLVTKLSLFYIGGIVAFGASSFTAYKLFNHVRVRVEAWQNPWEDIDGTGYQITQSLFAIGAGGLVGTGLTKGVSYMVPVVKSDFIFSAICEEFGNIFSVVLICILIVFLFTIIDMAYVIEDKFSLIITVGLGVVFAFQQFLIIGGVTKLIPSTGVTLPFISYGGSSLITSCVMIGLLQGVYMLNIGKKVEGLDED